MNPPKLTILAADTDAACDPGTGTCTIPQALSPSPDIAPAPGTIPGTEETQNTGPGRAYGAASHRSRLTGADAARSSGPLADLANPPSGGQLDKRLARPGQC